MLYDEANRQHLEFIQNVITRMNSNSFLIKGWMITLVSALYALAAKDADLRYVVVTYFTVPVFWFFDAFYLSQERQYRALYNYVRTLDKTDFSMDASSYKVGKNSWLGTLFSRTMLVLYPPVLGITLLVMFWMG